MSHIDVIIMKNISHQGIISKIDEFKIRRNKKNIECLNFYFPDDLRYIIMKYIK